MHIPRRMACIVPETAYVIQLVQFVPGLNTKSQVSAGWNPELETDLIAMEMTKNADPGLCMIIVRMLSAPTSLILNVCTS
jgi:hypothetical protein